MPNWLEGTFKARGKQEDMIYFVSNMLLNRHDKHPSFLGDMYDDEDIWFKFEYAGQYDTNWIHILNKDNDLRRHYIVLRETELCLKRLKNNELQLVENFTSAWSIDENKIGKLAKDLNIDIRVCGFECGYKFYSEFEFDRTGEEKLCIVKSYNDYDWECPMPLLGG